MYQHNGIWYTCGTGPLPLAGAGSSFGSRSASQGRFPLSRLDMLGAKLIVGTIIVGPIIMLIANVLIG